jgi:tetratricopeptide (TPR) repeat protein
MSETSRNGGAVETRGSTVARSVDRAAGPLVLLSAAALAMRRLADSDTWWHLAAGRWIVANGGVPRHDPFSYTVADHAWINLQWLYDVFIYAVFQVAGPSGLVLASVVLFTAATAVLYGNLRLWLAPAVAAALTLWAVVVCEERFLIRPEMFSLLLLGLVVAVLLRMRRDEGRRLWLLPVLMLVWVNVHSLFIIGLFCIACAVAGALASRLPLLPAGWREASALEPTCMRRLLLASSAAAAVTLANPYGWEGVVFPLELLTRIDGSNSVFASIGEFKRPFSGYFTTLPITAYQLMFFFGTAVIFAAAVAGWTARKVRRHRPETRVAPGFDLASVAWFWALAYVSLLARRNIGLFAIAATPIVGLGLAILADRLPRDARRLLERAATPAAFAVSAAALVLTVSVVTNGYYFWNQTTQAFGVGVFEANFPVYASSFAREAELPGKMYNDLSAGGYLTWSRPVEGGVFIDGRLEVYDDFFDDYRQELANPQAWDEAAGRHGYQTAIIFHRWPNRHRLIQALERSPSWTRLYVDDVAVVFVLTKGNSDVIARARPVAEKWNAVNEERLATRGAASWQSPVERYVGLKSYAMVLGVLGDSTQALKRLEQAFALEPSGQEAANLLVQMAYHRALGGDRERAKLDLLRALELSPGHAQAEDLLARLGG